MALAAAPATPGPLAQPMLQLVEGLDPEQRSAALLPDGPAQIIAPAGSGKTTTLVARLGVLVARGVPGERIAVVTFNREAATELRARITRQLAPVLPSAARIEVRTLHALARQVLLDAGLRVRLVADRAAILRRVRRDVAAGRVPRTAAPEVDRLDTAISAWKVEGRAPDADLLPFAEAYGRLLATRELMDFDDLVGGAVARLEADASLRGRWQTRFSHVLVDEFQDVDAAQLRLVRTLAEPQRNLFVVGDDDQTIYAWRLADVRRILAFRRVYPDAGRVVLATNYRCPTEVVAAARRLIEHNRERIPKPIRASRAGVSHRGAASVIGAMPARGERWADEVAAEAARASAQGTVSVLARTEGELLPIVLALVRARLRHATRLTTPLDAPPALALLEDLRRLPAAEAPFHALLRARAARGWRRGDDLLSDDDHTALDALLGWAAGYRTIHAFLDGADAARRRVDELRDPAAPIELLTVHGAKGREWDTVIVVGLERDRFPNRRALAGAADPARAQEEERRLAYVAFTRARRRLILALDPARPSAFLGEAGLGVLAG